MEVYQRYGIIYVENESLLRLGNRSSVNVELVEMLRNNVRNDDDTTAEK
jgi:hypothetical protein